MVVVGVVVVMWVIVCVYVCMHMCAKEHAWRPEDDLRLLSPFTMWDLGN